MLSAKLQHAVVSLLMVSALGGAALQRAQAEAPAEEPAYKEFREHSIGRIKETAWGSGRGLPINYSWQELSAEDQARFKAQYEGLGETDEPPYPVGGPKSFMSLVSTIQQRLIDNGEEVRGEFTALVKVSPSGKVAKVQVFRTPNTELAQWIGKVLISTPFKPAICAGTPCEMDYPVKILFK